MYWALARCRPRARYSGYNGRHFEYLGFEVYYDKQITKMAALAFFFLSLKTSMMMLTDLSLSTMARKYFHKNVPCRGVSKLSSYLCRREERKNGDPRNSMCKGPEMGQDSGCEELPDCCRGSVRRAMKREKMSCVTLDETGEVCRVFRAVKDSGL